MKIEVSVKCALFKHKMRVSERKCNWSLSKCVCETMGPFESGPRTARLPRRPSPLPGRKKSFGDCSSRGTSRPRDSPRATSQRGWPYGCDTASRRRDCCFIRLSFFLLLVNLFLCINRYAQAKVSMQRILDFLCAEEADPYIVKSSPEGDEK